MGGLFIQTLQTDPRYFFAVVITVVISITLHELAHGIAAIQRGDDTPRYSGHMTLSPLVHMGGMSLVMLAIAGIAWGAMPIDPTRMRGKYAEAYVAFAGPFTNILLALLALVSMGLWLRFFPTRFPFDFLDVPTPVGNIAYFLLIFGSTNILLAIFNLIPVPPLDGSRIVANFVPAYHRAMGSPAAQGILVAVFFALFMGAGRFIREWSFALTELILNFVSGNHS